MSMYYFDYAATTPVDARVMQKMQHYMGMEGVFGNPSSVTHAYGQAALKAVEEARKEVAETIHACSSEIIFTSGATESNQLALMGAARMYQRKGKHIITSQTEHASVLGVMRALEREGFEVTYLKPQSDGLIDLSVLESHLRPDTILLSLMHVNNETGVVQPLEKVGQILKGKGVIFHADAAQSVGKIAVDVQALGVDLLSLCAHKTYGPKGVGALYMREKPRVRITPLTFGGGQERGYRAGTLATHQIVGMGEAFRIAREEQGQDTEKCTAFKTDLIEALSVLEGVHINGHTTQTVPFILNFWMEDVASAALFSTLPALALSASSACSAALQEASHVLKAMGLTDTQALNAVRISMGRFTTQADVEQAITLLKKGITSLRRPKNAQITLTEAAKAHVLYYLEKKTGALGVRFSVKKTGCSGLSYVVEYVDFLPQDDLVSPLSQNYQIFVDKPSYAFLQGVTVDCVKDNFGKKLVFQNPNKKGECGCGESFIT